MEAIRITGAKLAYLNKTQVHRFLNLSLISTLFFCASCRDTNTKLKATTNTSHQVFVQDTFAINCIVKYITENHIDARHTLIYATFKKNDEGSVAYITHSFNQLKYKDVKPSHYTIIDSSMVLLYGGDESFVKVPGVQQEVEAMMLRNNVNLSKYYVLEHNLITRIQLCGGQHKKEIDQYFLDDIPCGYRITNEKGKLILSKY